MKPRIIILLTALTLLQTVHTKVKKKGDFKSFEILKPKDHYKLELRFRQTLDLSNIKYPLTVESEHGKGVTYQTQIHKNDISSQGLEKIGFSKILDKDLIITASATKPVIHTRVVEGETGFNGKSSGFVLDFPTTKKKNFVCEDAIFVQKSRTFYLGCRAPKIAESEKSAVALIAFEFDSKNEIKQKFMIDFFEEDGLIIQNRLRLNPIVNKEGETLILMHDQFVENGKDKEIMKKVRPFRLLGNAFDVEKPLVVSDESNSLETVKDFTIFRDQLMVVGKRKDKGNSLCLTKLEFNTEESKIVTTLQFQCTDIEGTGFATISEGSNLITFNDKTKEIEIQRVNHDFKANPWILELMEEYELGTVKMKGGIRSIHEGEGVFVATFNEDQGVADQGNTLVVSTGISLAYVPEQATGVVFNNIFVQVTPDAESFHRIEFPFFEVVTQFLEKGDNQLAIKVYDADMKSEEALTINGKVTVIDKPFGKIEAEYSGIKSTVYPGLRMEHHFRLSNIKAGNEVKVEILEPEGIEGVVAKSYNSRVHKLNFKPEIPKTAKIQNLNVVSGAAFLRDSTTDKIHWYQCFEQSELETECSLVAKTKTYGKALQDVSGAVLEVAYTAMYYEPHDVSYFSWFEFGDGWEYEHFKGRIVDVNHVISKKGKVFTVIALTDRVVISLFFDQWYYGNRKSEVFYHYDVDGYEFCPTQVTIDSDDATRVFVLSSCNDVQEIFEFDIDEEGNSVKFIRSRDVGTKIKDPKMCIIGSEMLLYSRSTHELFSLNKFSSMTRAKINIELYGFDNIQDFECDPEKNLFTILTTFKDKDPKIGATSQVLIMRGGKFLNVYQRIVARITGKSKDFVKLETYNHKEDIVVVLWDEGNNIYYERVYLKEPLLVVNFDKSRFTQTEQFEMKLKLSNRGTQSLLGDQMMTPLTLPTKEILKPTQKIKYEKGKTIDISTKILSSGDITSVKMKANTLKKLRFSDGTESQQPMSKTEFYSWKEGDTSYLINHRQVGRFQRFKTFDVVSTYTKSSPFHYGFIELMKNRERVDSFYSENSFRFVESIQLGEDVISAVLLNKGKKADLGFVLAKGGKFIDKIETVAEATDFDILKLYVAKEPSSETEGQQPVQKYELGLLALSQKTGIIRLFRILPEFGEDKWEVVAVEFDKLGDTVKDFAISIRPSQIGFYYIKKDTEGIDRKFIQKNKFKFEEAKVQLTQQPAKKPTTRYASIACEEFGPGNTDKCVASIYGGKIYYIQYNIQSGQGERQAPTQYFYDLVRYGEFMGHRLAVSGRFVFQESDLLSTRESKKLLVWDIDIVKENREKRKLENKLNSVTSVIDMKKVDSPDSKNSKILGTSKKSDGSVEVFMEVEDEKSDQVLVISKIVYPWTVKLGNQDFDEVKNLELEFGQGEGKKTVLKVEDIFEQ